jgi:hypothetical protein
VYIIFIAANIKAVSFLNYFFFNLAVEPFENVKKGAIKINPEITALIRTIECF